jgi:RNA recognition motif-containing protein
LSIYIGNVDYGATEEDLKEAFQSCGEIARVTIIKNMRTGHSKGVAFIEFMDKSSVDIAMGYNGKEVRGT